METSSTGGSLSADIKIENLSVEEFEFVLNQLTDHNLPEREKCPLVQHLNAEDARNNSYSSTDTVQTLTTTTATNGGGNVTSGCGGGGGGGGGNNNRNHNNRNNNETNRSKSKSSLHVLSKDNEFRLNHNQQQRQQQATLPQSSSTANQNNHYYHHHHNHHHPEQHYQNVSSNSNNYSKRMNGSNHNTNINNNNNNNKIKTQSSIIHQNFVECRLDTDTITTNSCGCGGIESSNHSGNDKWSSSLSTNNKSNMMMTSNIKATTTTASTIASMSPMSGSLLMSDSGVTAYGSNGGSKDGANSNNDNISLNNNNLKPNRANSFRMPSPSDNNILVVEQQQAENIIIVNNNNNNTSLSHQVDHLNHLHGRQFDHSQTMIERNVQDQGSTLLLNDNNSDSALENSSQSYGDINSNPNQNKYSTATLSTNTKFNQLQNRSSTMSINNINNMEQQQHSFSSQHLNSISSLVNKISKESPYRGILQSDNNNNKGIHFNNTNSANLIDGDCCEDNGKMYVEMKNLPQKANIIEYNADMKNNTNHSHHHHVGYKDSNSVDRVIEMPMLNSSRPIDDQYALNTTSSSSASPPNNSQFNYSYSFNNTNNINNNNSIIPSSGSVSNRREKKKKQKEEVKFSQDIEGHIGFMDISTLELIINNTSSSSGGVGANGNGSVNTDNNENNNNKKSGNKNHQKHDQNNEQISGQTKNNRNNNNHNENKKIITNNSMNNKNHSNSLSCDDISVDNNKNFNEIGMLNNTSPELSSNNNNNNKSKKNKSKRRQENSNNNHANNKNGHNGKMNRKKLTNSTSDSKLEELTSHSDNKDENNEKENDKSQNANNEDQTKKQSVKRQPHGGDGNVANSNNSSSDDFDDATDAEDEGEDDLKLSSILIRSKKSNSLLPTSKEIDLNDVQHEFCTVSDSEMDREKDFVTPKNKYLKRKKHLARNLNNSMPSSSSSSANHNKDTLAKNTNFAATASRNSHQHPPLHHQQQFHHYQHSQQPYMNQVTTGNKHSTIVNANHLGRGYESEREFSVNNNNSKSNPTCVSQSLSSSMLAIDGGVNKKPTNTSAKSLPPTTTSSLPQQTNSKEIVETKKVIEEFPSNTIHTANSENNLNIFLNDKDNCTGSSDNSGLKIPSYAEIAKSFNVTNAKPAQLATKLSSHSLNPTIENSTTTTSANINVVSAQNPDGVDDEFPQLDSSSTTKSEMVHNNNHDIEGDSVKSNNDNDVKNESADAIEHIAIADNGVETNAVANNADASDKAAKLPTIDQIGKNLNDNCRSDSFIEEDNQEEKTKIQKNINNNHPTSEMTHPKDNSVKNMTNNIPINSRSKNNNSVSGPVFIYGSESKNNNNNKFWKHTGNNCDDDEKTQFTDNNPLLPDGFAGFWGGEKIVFGFFDDIQNEFDEIQDNCSLDKIPGCAHAKVLDSETIKVKASFTDQSEPIETLHENGGSENNDQIKESCPTNAISVQCNKSNNEDVDFESFKKNAVHVNDLENNWQKEASKTIIKHSDKGEISGVTDKIDHQAVTVVANPKRALSSTASSPLSSFDSSPVSSATTVSSSSIQSNQPKQPLCFISCLKKYRNISLNDNAELNITNYAGLINYIYNHWVNRKSL